MITFSLEPFIFPRLFINHFYYLRANNVHNLSPIPTHSGFPNEQFSLIKLNGLANAAHMYQLSFFLIVRNLFFIVDIKNRGQQHRRCCKLFLNLPFLLWHQMKPFWKYPGRESEIKFSLSDQLLLLFHPDHYTSVSYDVHIYGLLQSDWKLPAAFH